MKRVTIRRTGRKADSVADLLKRAMAQPGVRTLLQVYRGCQAVQGSFNPYWQASQERPNVSASNTSHPTSW